MKTKALAITILMLFVIVRMLTLAQSTLEINSITPNTMTSTDDITITINGHGFVEETVIQLSNIGTVSDTFINENELSVDTPELVAGTYSISAINPNGDTVSLDNALIVIDPTVEPTEQPTPTTIPLVITSSEPQRVINNQENTLSILGSGFTQGVVVRLNGYGLLTTTYLHGGAITASIPSGVPAGQYMVEVSDALGRSIQSPTNLTVVAPAPVIPPPATPQPLPTSQITLAPALGVTSFTANPTTITAGQSTRLTFTVQNRGNQMARTISASLGTGSSFVVSGGQASISIPDLMPNASYSASMMVTAQQSITAGANTIPLRLSYSDTAGESYTGDTELSVMILSADHQSQIVVDAYVIEPSLPEPGDTVSLRMTLMNSGNTVASQVAVRVTGTDSILLPSNSGDTFVIGTLQPNVRTPLIMPLIVSSTAEAGAQVQPLTIDYMQDGEAKQITTGITVTVATVDQPQPLILLSSYDTGVDILQPGTRFTLDITLQNVGLANANSTTVTFGTVQSNTGGEPPTDPNNPDNGGSVTPSTTFAPLGTAGVSYVGELSASSSVDISQEFIVAGDVTTGIYTLPITVQYTLADSTKSQSTLNLSLVVIAPPRLRINPQNPLPESVTAGEPVPLMLELANVGRRGIDLTDASVSAINGEVLEGTLIQLETLATDDDTSLNALIMPLEEGTLEVSVTIAYLNELGQSASIDLIYSGQVNPAPEPIEEPFEPEPIVEEPEPEVNWFGRIVMALVGLGS